MLSDRRIRDGADGARGAGDAVPDCRTIDEAFAGSRADADNPDAAVEADDAAADLGAGDVAPAGDCATYARANRRRVGCGALHDWERRALGTVLHRQPKRLSGGQLLVDLSAPLVEADIALGCRRVRGGEGDRARVLLRHASPKARRRARRAARCGKDIQSDIVGLSFEILREGNRAHLGEIVRSTAPPASTPPLSSARSTTRPASAPSTPFFCFASV